MELFSKIANDINLMYNWKHLFKNIFGEVKGQKNWLHQQCSPEDFVEFLRISIYKKSF